MTHNENLSGSKAGFDILTEVGKLYEAIFEGDDYGKYHSDLCLLDLSRAGIAAKQENDDSVYADITVNVIIDPEIAVCDLLTQTQLSYRYEPSGVDEYTYTDISIRFGGRISKAVWNEIEATYDITGFGVMITAYEENL